MSTKRVENDAELLTFRGKVRTRWATSNTAHTGHNASPHFVKKKLHRKRARRLVRHCCALCVVCGVSFDSLSGRFGLLSFFPPSFFFSASSSPGGARACLGVAGAAGCVRTGVDHDSHGWRGRFTLVFSSLTAPRLPSYEGLAPCRCSRGACAGGACRGPCGRARLGQGPRRLARALHAPPQALRQGSREVGRAL